MTIYAGETVTITHAAKDIEGLPITNLDVLGVEIIIYDKNLAVVVTSPMTWNAQYLRWDYIWDTSPGATPVNIAPGSYRAKCTITGMDMSTNWEFKRLRLARNPV
jgi:hypothetical protein